MYGFHISFDIAAFLICFVCLVYCHTYLTITTDRSRYFRWMLGDTMICAVTNIICNSISDLPLPAYFGMLEGISAVYFLSHNLLGYLFLRYVIEINDVRENVKKMMMLAMYVMLAFMEALILLNPFTHVSYAYVNGVYDRNIGLTLIYVINAVFLALALFTYIKKRKALTKQMSWWMSFMLVIGMAALVIQMVWPNFSVELLGETCAFLGALLVLEAGSQDIDPFTGLRARKSFENRTKHYVSAGSEVLLTVIRLDGMSAMRNAMPLRNYNDAVSDFAAVLERVNAEDEVFRYSSDTFCTYLKKGSRISWEKYREEVTKLLRRISSTSTIGSFLDFHVSFAKLPEDLRTEQEIMAVVTRTLPRTSHGLNVYDCKDLQYIHESMFIQDEIVKALKENRYTVYYQPIIDCRTGKVASAEALVRMKRKDGSLVPPVKFIPVAEESGLINDIDELVLSDVCRLFAEHQVGIPYIELNVSAFHISAPDLQNTYMNTLKKYDVPASKVNLEITETGDITSRMTKFMNLMVNNGFRFSLDDYGTGYSGLQRLLVQPFTNIKFDKSLLDHARDNEQNRLLYEASIKTVQNMGFEVIQEGVETEEQKDYVQSLGCRLIQGFYYAKPMPVDQFLEYIAAKA